MTSLSTPIWHIKTSRPVERLHYQHVPTDSLQARLRGRYELRPVFDLDLVTCRSVVDWVKVEIAIGRSTQFWRIQKKLERHLGIKPFVKALDVGANEPTNHFHITIQDSKLSQVNMAMGIVAQEFGFTSPPRPIGLEVSVDFKPKDGNYDYQMLTQMHAILCRHLRPQRDVFSDWSDRPRFVWGNGPNFCQHVFPGSDVCKDNPSVLAIPDNDNLVPADATYFLGAKNAPAMNRVMIKTIDHQNPANGTFVELPLEEHRTRVEVRLQGVALSEVEIFTMEDLVTFRFEHLQSHHFRFMLSTLSEHAKYDQMVGNPVRRYREKERELKCLRAGVLGVEKMDEARQESREQSMPLLKAHLKERGKPPPQRRRTGLGKNGSQVAFEKLNKLTRTSLHSLSDRWTKS